MLTFTTFNDIRLQGHYNLTGKVLQLPVFGEGEMTIDLCKYICIYIYRDRERVRENSNSNRVSSQKTEKVNFPSIRAFEALLSLRQEFY